MLYMHLCACRFVVLLQVFGTNPPCLPAFQRNAVTASAMQTNTLTHESDTTTSDSPGEPDSHDEHVETWTKQHAERAPQAPSPDNPTSSLVLGKTRLVQEIATRTDVKKKTVKVILDALTSVITHQVRYAGKATIPGLCTIKCRVQQAIEPQERHLFGRIMTVKAKPAQTKVTVKCLGAFKKSI